MRIRAKLSAVFSPKKELSSVASKTVCEQTRGPCMLKTHYEADYYMKQLQEFLGMPETGMEL